MANNARLVLFSSGDFPLALMERLYEEGMLVGLITKPDRPAGRGLRLRPNPAKSKAMELGLRDIFEVSTFKDKSKREELRIWLERLKPDLALVADFGLFIPAGVRRMFKLILNLHPSLLPLYRGAAPIERALMSGERVTGLSLCRLTGELDAGEIYWQMEVAIEEGDNAVSLKRKLDLLASEHLPSVLRRVLGGEITPWPQDHPKASYAPKIDKSEYLLSIDLLPQEFVNRVRALYPKAHLYCRRGKGKPKRLLIRRARPYPAEPIDLKEGRWSLTDEGLLLRLKEGAVMIEELQWESGKVLTSDSLHGYNVREWEVFKLS